MGKGISTIVLAAGKGVRMKSKLPKVAFKLDGISLIERVVKTVSQMPFHNIIVVIGYKKEIVKDCLKEYKDVKFALQKEQNGTGHAVMAAKDFFLNYDGNIIIIPGDVPLLTKETLVELEALHCKEDASATVLTAILDNPAEYGRIVRDRLGSVKRIVEFKDATEDEKRIREINSGIFCFKTNVLFSTLQKINNNNAQKELYLTDILEILKKEGEKVAAMTVTEPIEISGVNSREQLAFLENYLQNNKH
jgi:UDP-N-acetylglucosamine diphosphorylase/glucosamine-1-phosphate N-acetyltransferase